MGLRIPYLVGQLYYCLCYPVFIETTLLLSLLSRVYWDNFIIVFVVLCLLGQLYYRLCCPVFIGTTLLLSLLSRVYWDNLYQKIVSVEKLIKVSILKTIII